MTEPGSPIAPGRNFLMGILVAGTVALVAALAIAIFTQGQMLTLVVLLGASIALFAVAAIRSWTPARTPAVVPADASVDYALAPTQAQAPAKSEPSGESAPLKTARTRRAPVPSASAQTGPSRPPVVTGRLVDAAPEPRGRAADATDSLSMLLHSTLGDLLQAALLKDPDRVRQLEQWVAHARTLPGADPPRQIPNTNPAPPQAP